MPGQRAKRAAGGHHFRLSTHPIRLNDLLIAIVVVTWNRAAVNCLRCCCSVARARAHTRTCTRLTTDRRTRSPDRDMGPSIRPSVENLRRRDTRLIVSNSLTRRWLATHLRSVSSILTK